jgi:hypothetical protein
LRRGTRQFYAPSGGDNIRAGGGKAFCERQANAAGPANHDCDFVGEIKLRVAQEVFLPSCI